MRSHKTLFSTLAALLLAASAPAQETASTAVIWRDRGNPAALNLLTGPGGVGTEPGTEFRFLQESDNGSAPKFDVEDERGVHWKVKMGPEVRSETAAARLLWAVGYVVDEDYYRPQIHVRDMQKLARGRQFVAADGTVTGVRLERDLGDAESATWSWYDNPLVGTREFNGLRVMMALINNWDLKAVNNSEPGAASRDRAFSITDLGATFGRTGNALGRSKGVAKDYVGSRFIDKVTATHVDFVLHSRPFFPTIVFFRNYRFRTRMEHVVKDIPIEDARWIGQRLGQLSPTQIGDCFRAAGFSPSEVDAYTQVVLARIAALQALGPATSAALTVQDGDVSVAASARGTRLAPRRETLATFRLGTPYARGVVGGFEQGAGIGAGAQLTSATALPDIEFRATALTSTKGARRFDAGALMSTGAGSRTHADVSFTYLERDTAWFGLGPDSSPAEATFAIERHSYQGSLYRDLAEHLQSGLFVQLNDTRSVLEQQTASSKVMSYGAFVSYDTRDTSNGLTRGLNLYGRLASSTSVGVQDASGPYGWTESEADVRAYAPLGSARTSLLMRARGQFQSAHGGSRIPYYDLSWLGGRTFLRGAPAYRYRGENVLLLASELQQTVLPMSRVRGIDVFGAADTGQIWSAPEGLRHDNWRTGLGGGLQYRHSARLAARVEMSRGSEGTQTYVSMTRGF